MARGQSHLFQIGGVPRAHDNAAIEGVVDELVHNIFELVDTLAGVIRLGVDVLGAKVPPLESIHGS